MAEARLASGDCLFFHAKSVHHKTVLCQVIDVGTGATSTVDGDFGLNDIGNGEQEVVANPAVFGGGKELFPVRTQHGGYLVVIEHNGELEIAHSEVIVLQKKTGAVEP
jgi:hypothetical protein